MLNRVLAAARLLRPRVIAEIRKDAADTRRTVERLRTEIVDLQHVLKSVQAQADAVLRIEQRVAELQDAHRMHAEGMATHLSGLGRDVSELRLRESQLRAVARRDAELDRRLPQLETALDEAATAVHVRDRITATPLRLHPFPYVVVDDLLPSRLYDALLNAIPPVELFADRPFNKRQLGVPPLLAPVYSRRVWRFVANAVAPRAIVPAVLDKFRDPLTAWLDAQLVPGALALLERMEMACTDGRILLRGRGYSISPHRDPKWGFITCLLYLARPSDDPNLGTDLYSVEGDSDAPDTKPHWIPPDRCRLEATVEFRPNRALILLNSAGAHGARIPDDAPESLERYLYQFRIGPGRGQMRELLAELPEHRRVGWEGKITDY
jgi:hypothetical protein